MGGRGGSSGIAAKGAVRNFTEDKSGVRTYDDTGDGRTEFRRLSENMVDFNKVATVMQTNRKPVKLKKSQIWDYLKNNNIHEFLVQIDKVSEKRTLKQLEDYGYHVTAKSGENTKATQKWHTVLYHVGKKEQQYLGLDLKVKKLYKRGWKG